MFRQHDILTFIALRQLPIPALTYSGAGENGKRDADEISFEISFFLPYHEEDINAHKIPTLMAQVLDPTMENSSDDDEEEEGPTIEASSDPMTGQKVSGQQSQAAGNQKPHQD